tara:strand:- start:227 stop:835 length:609 start_codon:yes stop_codon:yes gene_type:complete
MKKIAMFAAFAVLVSFSSCEEDAVLGCNDASADNYNSSATENDGSCTYTVLGCTDGTATNFNAAATVDDGSCTYAGDMYAGTYDASEDCGEGWSWEQVITADGNEITLVNAFDWGVDISLEVSGNTFSFTDVAGSIISGGTEYTVVYTTLDGEISGDTIAIHYVIAAENEDGDIEELFNCEPVMTLSQGGLRYNSAEKPFIN